MFDRNDFFYKNLFFFQAYRSPDSHLVRLFCCGFYEEIVIMDPMTLSLVFTLSSRINPDWISAFHVLRPRNRNDDVVLALTTTGTVKVIAYILYNNDIILVYFFYFCYLSSCAFKILRLRVNLQL